MKKCCIPTKYAVFANNPSYGALCSNPIPGHVAYTNRNKTRTPEEIRDQFWLQFGILSKLNQTVEDIQRTCISLLSLEQTLDDYRRELYVQICKRYPGSDNNVTTCFQDLRSRLSICMGQESTLKLCFIHKYLGELNQILELELTD